MKKKKLEHKLSRTRKKLSKAEAKIGELKAALQNKSKPEAFAAVTPSPAKPAVEPKPAATRQTKGVKAR